MFPPRSLELEFPNVFPASGAIFPFRLVSHRIVCRWCGYVSGSDTLGSRLQLLAGTGKFLSFLACPIGHLHQLPGVATWVVSNPIHLSQQLRPVADYNGGLRGCPGAEGGANSIVIGNKSFGRATFE